MSAPDSTVGRMLRAPLDLTATTFELGTETMWQAAATVPALVAAIRVPAGAVAPLQGTTQRLGRLTDRLPDRRRRRADGDGDQAP